MDPSGKANLPVIFLTFANDRQEAGQFLKALEPERTALHRILSTYQQKAWGLYHSAGSSDPVELKRDLSQHSGRISIFHFSGHADGTQLRLEGSDGSEIALHQQSLLAFLKEEPQLKLVFLNACATAEHVEQLLALGIPAVIATERSVSDADAQAFSESFYTDLVAGKTLKTAFEAARAVINPQASASHIHRRLKPSSDEGKQDWGLFVREEAMLDWKLSRPAKPRLGISRVAIFAAGLILLLGGIAALTGINLQEMLGFSSRTSQSLTVRVHGPGGKDDRVLAGEGEVSLILGQATRVEITNRKGEVHFQEIPREFFTGEEKARLHFRHAHEYPEPYAARFPDSLYSLEAGQVIDLAVHISGLGQIQGIVYGPDNLPLQGVLVQVQGMADSTNQIGHFKLDIPVEKQAKFQMIRAFKSGFEPYAREHPILPQELILKLRPAR
ncbi:MAG: CHAT domain-containing protein [Bacteroidota bacterium]